MNGAGVIAGVVCVYIYIEYGYKDALEMSQILQGTPLLSLWTPR